MNYSDAPKACWLPASIDPVAGRTLILFTLIGQDCGDRGDRAEMGTKSIGKKPAGPARAMRRLCGDAASVCIWRDRYLSCSKLFALKNAASITVGQIIAGLGEAMVGTAVPIDVELHPMLYACTSKDLLLPYELCTSTSVVLYTTRNGDISRH